MVKQISVFLENKAGRLASVTRVLGDAGINIRALSIADTSDFGVLRLIVNDPEKAYQILRDAGFTVSQTDVVAVSVPDRPGGLAEILQVMAEAEINIEYLYAFIGTAGQNALVIFKVEDVERTITFFKEKGISFLEAAQVYSL